MLQKSLLDWQKKVVQDRKIQSFTPDTMTIDSSKPDFLITEGLWKGYTLYDLYKEAYTPFEWHQELFPLRSGNWHYIVFVSIR